MWIQPVDTQGGHRNRTPDPPVSHAPAIPLPRLSDPFSRPGPAADAESRNGHSGGRASGRWRPPRILRKSPNPGNATPLECRLPVPKRSGCGSSRSGTRDAAFRFHYVELGRFDRDLFRPRSGSVGQGARRQTPGSIILMSTPEARSPEADAVSTVRKRPLFTRNLWIFQ